MLSLAIGAVRLRPATFAGLAASVFLAVATVTLFGCLIATAVTSDGQSELGLIAGAFGEIAMLMSLFLTATTLAYSVRQQQRDLAVVRTIGATPRQVRRLVRLQVLVVVLLLSAPAWVAGALGARVFLRALARHQLAPAAAVVPGSPVPMVAATVVTAAVGAVVTAAAVRAATHGRPAAAMLGAAAPPRGPATVRTVAGVLGAAGVAVLCRFLSGLRPDEAAQAALLGALAMMVTVALLGPVLARCAVALLGWPLQAVARRLPGDAGSWLATANLRGHAHRLSTAVVPLALLVGLSTAFLAVTGTIRHVAAGADLAGATSARDVWLRGVELVMLACFGAVATVHTLIAVTSSRRGEYTLLRLLGSTRPQLVRMIAAEAVLVAATGVVLGLLVAAPTSLTFAATLTGFPRPWVPVDTYGPIVAGSVLLAAGTVLATGVWATRRESTMAVVVP